MFRQTIMLFAIAASALIAVPSSARDNDDEVLTVGSKAPELDVEHWISNGEGRFKPVTKFESGKVYVVEFWATWCGPCVASMPHISELQTKYADKGVQVISISDEDLDTVNEFLEKKVRGEKEMTYAQLTGKYCLTADPDESSHEDYMRAAQQNGIPSAFIVGKDGVIEWIGHPLEMDEPLEQIVDGKWDRDAYVKKMKEEKAAMAEIQKEVGKAAAKMQAEEFDDAVAIMDKLVEKYKDHDLASRLKAIRMQMQMAAGGRKAAKALTDFAKENSSPEMLNQIAWSVVQMKMNGQDVDDDVLGAAVKVAKQAVEADSKNGAVLDTLAHLLALSGDLDEAIRVQKQAIENADASMKEDLESYLEELQEEKQGDSEKDDQ